MGIGTHLRHIGPDLRGDRTLEKYEITFIHQIFNIDRSDRVETLIGEFNQKQTVDSWIEHLKRPFELQLLHNNWFIQNVYNNLSSLKSNKYMLDSARRTVFTLCTKI